MRSPPDHLVMSLSGHVHPTQMIGKMSVERRAFAPFRMRVSSLVAISLPWPTQDNDTCVWMAKP